MQGMFGVGRFFFSSKMQVIIFWMIDPVKKYLGGYEPVGRYENPEKQNL